MAYSNRAGSQAPTTVGNDRIGSQVRAMVCKKMDPGHNPNSHFRQAYSRPVLLQIWTSIVRLQTLSKAGRHNMRKIMASLQGRSSEGRRQACSNRNHGSMHNHSTTLGICSRQTWLQAHKALAQVRMHNSLEHLHSHNDPAWSTTTSSPEGISTSNSLTMPSIINHRTYIPAQGAPTLIRNAVA